MPPPPPAFPAAAAASPSPPLPFRPFGFFRFFFAWIASTERRRRRGVGCLEEWGVEGIGTADSSLSQSHLSRGTVSCRHLAAKQ